MKNKKETERQILRWILIDIAKGSLIKIVKVDFNYLPTFVIGVRGVNVFYQSKYSKNQCFQNRSIIFDPGQNDVDYIISVRFYSPIPKTSLPPWTFKSEIQLTSNKKMIKELLQY